MSKVRRRGDGPLTTLGGVLLGWLALRLAGFGDPVAAPAVRLAAGRAPIAAAGAMRADRPVGLTVRPGPMPSSVRQTPQAPRLARRRPIPAADPARTRAGEGPPGSGGMAVGAGPSDAPAPVLRDLPGAAVPGQGSRWGGDGWLLVRGGGGAAPGGTFYGASQAGAVLRYRLAPASAHAPELYLRGAAALAAAPGQDAAVGFGLRPFPRLPVRIGGEVRATRNRFSTRLRPALVAVSELPPQALPLGFTGDLYAQGGWIGGPAAQAFGDLQVHAEHPAGRAGLWQPRLGAGLWAAGQRGAERLDIGPVASVTGRVGAGPLLRLELDWRLRAAGNAAPGSGPALVLAASF